MTIAPAPESAQPDLIAAAARIVCAQLARTPVASAELPGLIHGVHQALARLGAPAVEAAPREPAVPIRSSVKPDYIVCLEDGARLKMLKRYLAKRHGLTPEQYRRRWGLPADYPMVAPNYSQARSALAKSIGLGHLRARA